jgi:salicylate hydroxylase
LWEYLYDGLPEGTVTFGVDVMSIENAESDEPQLSVLGITRSFDLIIGCDGGKSTIRQYVTSQLPVYAGYTVWRGLCPRAGVAGPPSGSARVGGFQFETLGFPCAGPESVGELWNCGIYMAMPEHLVSAPTRNRQVGSAMKTVPAWFIPLVRQLFGDRNARFWEKCAESGKVSPHPVWELAADRVVNRRVALLGDAAHMSSPRTGAGAYTAMVDAVVMGAAIEQAGGNIDEALRFYNDDTVRRGKDLYKRSRAAGSHFAPPGLTAVPPESLLA